MRSGSPLILRRSALALILLGLLSPQVSWGASGGSSQALYGPAQIDPSLVSKVLSQAAEGARYGGKVQAMAEVLSVASVDLYGPPLMDCAEERKLSIEDWQSQLEQAGKLIDEVLLGEAGLSLEALSQSLPCQEHLLLAEDLGRLYLLSGAVAALLGQDNEAQAHYANAFAVLPDLSWDRDLPRKARPPFDAAREAGRGASDTPFTLDLSGVAERVWVDGVEVPVSQRITLGLPPGQHSVFVALSPGQTFVFEVEEAPLALLSPEGLESIVFRPDAAVATLALDTLKDLADKLETEYLVLLATPNPSPEAIRVYQRRTGTLEPFATSMDVLVDRAIARASLRLTLGYRHYADADYIEPGFQVWARLAGPLDLGGGLGLSLAPLPSAQWASTTEATLRVLPIVRLGARANLAPGAALEPHLSLRFRMAFRDGRVDPLSPNAAQYNGKAVQAVPGIEGSAGVRIRLGVRSPFALVTEFVAGYDGFPSIGASAGLSWLP